MWGNAPKDKHLMTLYNANSPRNKSPHILSVNPALAKRILTTKLWDRQRPVRKRTVVNYAKQMTKGYWEPMSVIRFAVVGGNEYLVDGQHRLEAVVESNTTQEFVVIKQEVTDFDKVAKVYSSLDRGLSRTSFDQLHALGTDDLYGWNQTETNMISSAIQLILCDFNKPKGDPKLSGPELEDTILGYSEAAHKYVDLFKNTASKMIRDGMRRRATAAVALVTLSQSKNVYGDKVDEFWEGIAYDMAMESGDPRKMVLTHLYVAKMHGGGASNGSVSAYYSSRYIANCFNAFVDDRKITKTRVFPDKLINIYGSDYQR